MTQISPIDEVIDETLLAFDTEDLVDTLLFQITVNKEHCLVKLHGKAQGKVNGSEGLSFSRSGAGHHNRVLALLFRELGDLGPEDLVRIDLARAL